MSLPFQFPPLLNFSPPGASGAAGIGPAPNSNSGYALAQSDLMGEWGGGTAAGSEQHTGGLAVPGLSCGDPGSMVLLQLVDQGLLATLSTELTCVPASVC